MKPLLRLNLSVFLALASLLLTGLMMDSPPAAAVDKTKPIIVMAESEVKSTLSGARETAVDRCLKAAVENAVIGEFPISLLTEKFDAIGNLLNNRKDEFIQDYKVLQESKSEGVYRVLVQATISIEKIQQALAAAGITSTIERMPQVLVLISEQDAGGAIAQYWWQKEQPASETASADAVKTALQSKGIPVINPQPAQADILNDMQLSAALTDQDALEIGRRFFADAVVAGTAVAEETSNRMGENIRPVKGTVNVRVIFIQTRETYDPIEADATAADKDPSAGSRSALSDAGRQAGEKVAAQLIAKWEEMLKPSGEIILNIKGKNILANLNEFRNALKNTAGISNQRTLEIASDKAVLSVTYQGKSQELADAVLIQTFKGFGINIYEVAVKSLNIEMTPRQ